MMEMLKFLQARHEVTVVSFISSESYLPWAHELSRYCERVITVPQRIPALNAGDLRPRLITEYWMPEMRDTLLSLEQEQTFDLIDIEHIFMAQYAPFFATPMILHEHNIESLVMQRYAEFVSMKEGPTSYKTDAHFRDSQEQWPQLAAYELSTWPQFPVRITVSDLDRAEMQRRCPVGRVVTIPNGVDSRDFQPVAPLDAANALFTGTMYHQPNLDAAFELCDVIWPQVLQQMPNACLYIVGRSIPASLMNRKQDGKIEMISDAPSIIPYAARCSMSIVPLRVGGGTRIKILTSMALGLPVISTTIGCEGLNLRPGEDLAVVDHPAEFAQEIVKLFHDKEKRLGMAQMARIKVEEQYDWKIILQTLEQLFLEVAIASAS